MIKRIDNLILASAVLLALAVILDGNRIVWSQTASWGRVKQAATTSATTDTASFTGAVKLKVIQQINADRAAHGLKPVEPHPLAARAGDAHCREMLDNGYLSHWNLAGFKPYHRFSMIGGADYVSENASTLDCHPAGMWNADEKTVTEAALNAHANMMAEKPPMDGHRKCILDPAHTHVGIGLAFNGRGLRMTQEFINQYVELTAPVARSAKPGDTLAVRGKTLAPGNKVSSISVFYEPLPKPMSVAELRKTYSCSLPDDRWQEFPVLKEGWHYSDGSTGTIVLAPNGSFECPLRFKGGRPGLYTVCVWVEAGKDNSIPATSLTIRVE